MTYTIRHISVLMQIFLFLGGERNVFNSNQMLGIPGPAGSPLTYSTCAHMHRRSVVREVIQSCSVSMTAVVNIVFKKECVSLYLLHRREENNGADAFENVQQALHYTGKPCNAKQGGAFSAMSIMCTNRRLQIFYQSFVAGSLSFAVVC